MKTISLAESVIAREFEVLIQPLTSVTSTVYSPNASMSTTSVFAVAPLTGTPFLNHWYVAPGFGETAALKVVVIPGVSAVNGLALTTITGLGLTVNVEAFEVTLLHGLETIAR